MSEQYWGCSDKMSEANFSPAETLMGFNLQFFHLSTRSDISEFSKISGLASKYEVSGGIIKAIS